MVLVVPVVIAATLKASRFVGSAESAKRMVPAFSKKDHDAITPLLVTKLSVTAGEIPGSVPAKAVLITNAVLAIWFVLVPFAAVGTVLVASIVDPTIEPFVKVDPKMVAPVMVKPALIETNAVNAVMSLLTPFLAALALT